ncbi:beta-D-xylosidase 2 [Pelomyxa schiedti]|nr:beta-D-xylosidase 2 [Pelomyxa schiedti]
MTEVRADNGGNNNSHGPTTNQCSSQSDLARGCCTATSATTTTSSSSSASTPTSTSASCSATPVSLGTVDASGGSDGGGADTVVQSGTLVINGYVMQSVLTRSVWLVDDSCPTGNAVAKACLPWSVPVSSLCIVVPDSENGFQVHALCDVTPEANTYRTHMLFSCLAPSYSQAEKWISTLRSLIASTCPSDTSLPFLIFINPISGTKTALNLFTTHCEPLLTASGHTFEKVVTSKAGHAYSLVKSMPVDRYGGVITVGGDGMLSEVINGIMDRSDWKIALQRTPVGVIPAGTGNGLAMSLYGSKSIPCATCHIIRKKVQYIDLFLSTQPQFKLHMWGLVSCQWGLIADIDFESEKIRFLGGMRETIWGVWKVVFNPTYRGRITFQPCSTPEWKTTPCKRDCPLCASNSSSLHDPEVHPPSPTPPLAAASSLHLEDTDKSASPSPASTISSWITQRTPLDWTNDIPTLYHELFPDPFHKIGQDPPPGWEVHEGSFSLVLLCKIPHMMTDLLCAPYAHLGDGHMDLLWLPADAASRFRVTTCLIGLGATGDHATKPGMQYYKARGFTLEPLEPTGLLGVDGELVPFGPIQFRIASKIFPVFRCLMTTVVSRRQRGMIAVMGPQGVGKSTLLESIRRGYFSEPEYNPTLEDPPYQKHLEVDGVPVTLEFEERNAEEFICILDRAVKSANVILLCFSVTDRHSFDEAVDVYHPRIRKNSETVVFLVGLKSDLLNSLNSSQLSGSFVPFQTGIECSMKLGAYGFFQCSSKNRDELDNLCREIARAGLYSKQMVVSTKPRCPKKSVVSFTLFSKKTTKKYAKTASSEVSPGFGHLMTKLSASKDDINLAIKRLFTQRFELGMFDPDDIQVYTGYGPELVDSAYHQQLALQIARESMVLLQNNGILPLSKDVSVAVIGPNANAPSTYLGNYYGQRCHDGSYSCMQSIFTAIQSKAASAVYAKGCDINSQDTSGFQAAVNAAKSADVAVLVMGIDNSIESEGLDRYTTSLPGVQESLVETVYATGTPIIVVLVNGGALSIEWIKANVPGILEAFYSGQSEAQAVADVLFGDYNPGGKMPYTVYPSDYVNQIPLTEMGMSVTPGRTYRYYTGTPLWPFGWGLSYTNFSLTWYDPQASLPEVVNTLQTTYYRVNVTNTGTLAGDEVVLAYVTENAAASAIKQLFGFDRVHLEPGETKSVEFFAALGNTNKPLIHTSNGTPTTIQFEAQQNTLVHHFKAI